MDNGKFVVGQTFVKLIRIEEKDVQNFADVSGDYNPIHLDEEYAKDSIFKRRIVHGMLAVSYISGILGNEMPGNGTIYMGQNVRFCKPIYIGEDIRIELKITCIEERGRAKIATNVYNQENELVIEGEAYVKLPQL